MIFDLLDLLFLMTSVVDVCRRWRRLLLSGRFWRNRSMRELPLTVMYGLIDKSGGQLQALHFGGCTWIFDDVLDQLVAKCPLLER